MRNRSKKIGFFTAALLSILLLCGLQASAATLSLEGQKIEGTELYSGQVTVVAQLDAAAGQNLWIRDPNGWMLVPSQEKKGTYRLPFSGDGRHNVEFRVENPQTLQSEVQETSFTISNRLVQTNKVLSSLRDLEGADSKVIQNNVKLIQTASNKVNELTQEERRLLPPTLTGWLDKLKQEVEALGQNCTPPPPPSVDITCQGANGQGFYSSPVTITIKPGGLPSTTDEPSTADKPFTADEPSTANRPSAEDEPSTADEPYNNQAKTTKMPAPTQTSARAPMASTSSILVDQGTGWQILPQDSSGKFTIVLKDSGSYKFRFCAADAQNRSEAVYQDFVIDPEVATIVTELERFRVSVQDLPLDDYISQLETVYLSYLSLSPARQQLLPAASLEKMKSMYEEILQYIEYTPVQMGEDGRFIKAVGLYNSLQIKLQYLQRVPVAFHALREAPPASVAGVTGTPLATYRLSITPEEISQSPVALQVGYPVRIMIQLPTDLIGKKGVELFRIEEGKKPQAMGARVRSTEESMVLIFSADKLGDFVLVEQGAANK